MTENRNTHKISCQNATVVCKNSALEEYYPGGFSAFVEKFNPTVNDKICVLCFRGYKDADGLFEDLDATKMCPGDTYTDFFVFNERSNQSIDTAATWLQCTHNGKNAYVWYVEYPDQFPWTPFGEIFYDNEEPAMFDEPWKGFVESIQNQLELSLVIYRPFGPAFYSHCVYKVFGYYWYIYDCTTLFIDGPYRSLLDAIKKNNISILDCTNNIWCKEFSSTETIEHLSKMYLKSEITIPVNGELCRICPDGTVTPALQS